MQTEAGLGIAAPGSGQARPPLPLPLLCRWAAALLLTAPDAGGLAAYRTPEGRAFLDALGADPALAPVGATLADLVAPGVDLHASADRITLAHSRAFLMGGMRAIPPYASVWLSPRGLLWQEPAQAMARLLAACGLSVDPSTPEPPDHLGVQLDLLATLVEQEAAGMAPVIGAAEFTRDHLLNWLPLLAAASDRMREPFLYPDLIRGITAVLNDVVADDPAGADRRRGPAPQPLTHGGDKS